MFSSVAKITIIHTLIVIASIRQWHISQLDVKNVFLNRDIQEQVYMTPPPGVHMTLGMFVSSRKRYMVSNKHLVLDLRSSLL